MLYKKKQKKSMSNPIQLPEDENNELNYLSNESEESNLLEEQENVIEPSSEEVCKRNFII
jgi:hypothetical protein